MIEERRNKSNSPGVATNADNINWGTCNTDRDGDRSESDSSFNERIALANILNGLAAGSLDAVAALDGTNIALVVGNDGNSESSEGEELGVHF